VRLLLPEAVDELQPRCPAVAPQLVLMPHSGCLSQATSADRYACLALMTN
jgi:hypothetical protein